jgi:PAS domain S-box-containing protein
MIRTTFALRAGLKLILTIITVETLIMSCFQAFGVDTGQHWAGILDALILGLASTVVIYHWVIRPLNKSRQQNDLFNTLINSVDAGVVVVDPNQEGNPVTFANPAFSRISGYELQELLGRNPCRLFRRDHAGHDALMTMRQAIGEGKSTHILQRSSRRDGSLFWNDMYLNPIVDDHRKVLFWVAIVHDVTEKREMERENRRLAQAVQQSDEAVCIFDKKGEIEFANRAFYHNNGIAEQSLKGRDVWQFWQDHQLVDNEIKPAVENGMAWSGRHLCRRADGSAYEALTSIAPVIDSEDRADFYMAMHRDMSEMVELEKRFCQAQKMEAIGTLVGGIAHDFNNILAGITGNLYLVLREIGDQPKAVERIRAIESQSHRAADMIRQLLTFAREGELDIVPFDIRSMINETTKFISVGIPENIRFRCDIPAEALMVNGDPSQIQQVLMNLTTNACHAVEARNIEHGSIRIEVKKIDGARARENRMPESGRQYVQIAVSDNGIGMDEKTMQKIFEPFFTTKEVGKGTGLGLSMVAGCVEMHHGWIDADSRQGEGATISVFLPLLDETTVVGREQETELLKGNGELILIADDEEYVRRALRETLEDTGFRVVEACDGNHALEMFDLHIHEWQLVILDIVMPRSGGLSVAQRMSQLRPELPIALMTGYNLNESTRQEELQWHVLSKPWTVQSLNKVLKMTGKQT